eukprot:653411-Rhodomonas_salina.1
MYANAVTKEEKPSTFTRLFNGVKQGTKWSGKKAGSGLLKLGKLQTSLLKSHMRAGTVLAVWKHVIDAALAWGTGIVTGLQDVLYNIGDPACQ